MGQKRPNVDTCRVRVAVRPATFDYGILTYRSDDSLISRLSFDSLSILSIPLFLYDRRDTDADITQRCRK